MKIDGEQKEVYFDPQSKVLKSEYAESSANITSLPMIQAGKFSYAQPIVPKPKDHRDDTFFHYKRLGSVQYQESEEDQDEQLDVKLPNLNALSGRSSMALSPTD